MPTATTSGPIGHRPAGPDALRERAGTRREQQHARGDREERRARFERGVAEVGLQVHDQQEGDGAERGVHREGDRVRARELLRPEDAERHHRVLACAPRPGGTRRGRRCRRARARSRAAGQSLPGPSISAYTTPARPTVSSALPATSRCAPACSSRDSGTWRIAIEDRDRRDRQVDDEHPAPRHRIDEVAAEERAEGGGDAAEPRPRADGATAVLGHERRRHDGQAVRARAARRRRPARQRAAISEPVSGAIAHSSDVAANAIRPMTKIRRRPYRSPSEPPSTSSEPSVSR